ncbi:MlaD family protein [Tellurirhabdus bombi]|uniref:MlaD family protein n=1 Tax=Tellurirhabdus bombi TaxID=2907205 RepID=UPI001F276B5D|nr:MlaD family protein [Tellurirhabdus bombi]
MSGENNKRSVIVGIFVLLGIVIFVTGILVLGGQQKRFTSTIRIDAVFNDVGGLKVGNNVWFSGVKIGTVKKMSFVGNSQVDVQMSIETKAQHYIRKNSLATISSEGLIGNKIVVIFGGTTSVEQVEEGDRLASRPALSSDEMLETLQENNQNLLRVTKDFKELIGKIKQGKGTVGAVLTDSLLADNFRSTVSNLKLASQNTAQVSSSLSNYAKKLNNKGALANDLVTDTAVFYRLRSSAAQFEKASMAATATANNLEQASTKLTSNNNTLGTLLNDEEAAKNLKGTLRNLNSGSVKLDENLEALKHNFLFRGYFRKRAKEEAKRKEETQAAKPDSLQDKQ